LARQSLIESHLVSGVENSPKITAKPRITMKAQGSSPRLESAVFFFDPAGLNFAMET
jgi:hypothetical protein